MRIRRWVGWFAVAAILLHAGTLARHNVIRFQAIAAELAAPTGLNLAAICYVASEAYGGGPAPAVPGDGQDGTSKPCPICLGLISAHALPASEAPALPVAQTFSIARFVPQNLEPAPSARLSLHRTRGPPSNA
jgi:hypothetical protein